MTSKRMTKVVAFIVVCYLLAVVTLSNSTPPRSEAQSHTDTNLLAGHLRGKLLDFLHDRLQSLWHIVRYDVCQVVHSI